MLPKNRENDKGFDKTRITQAADTMQPVCVYNSISGRLLDGLLSFLYSLSPFQRENFLNACRWAEKRRIKYGDVIPFDAVISLERDLIQQSACGFISELCNVAQFYLATVFIRGRHWTGWLAAFRSRIYLFTRASRSHPYTITYVASGSWMEQVESLQAPKWLAMEAPSKVVEHTQSFGNVRTSDERLRFSIVTTTREESDTRENVCKRARFPASF